MGGPLGWGFWYILFFILEVIGVLAFLYAIARIASAIWRGLKSDGKK